MSDPTCPASQVTVQSWQSPATLLYLLCTAQVRLVDRAGHSYTVPDTWSTQRKLQVLDINLQNWAQPLLVPPFTRLGFERRQVPADLLDLLLSSLDLARAVREPCIPSGHINCQEEDQEGGATVEIVPLRRDREVRRELGLGLLEVAEEWSGLELELSTVYGPRRYRRDSRLALHVDRISSHVISAIINLNQQVDTPWLLDILDNTGRAHQVQLKEGEMLLYE